MNEIQPCLFLQSRTPGLLGNDAERCDAVGFDVLVRSVDWVGFSFLRRWMAVWWAVGKKEPLRNQRRGAQGAHFNFKISIKLFFGFFSLTVNFFSCFRAVAASASAPPEPVVVPPSPPVDGSTQTETDPVMCKYLEARELGRLPNSSFFLHFLACHFFFFDL